MDVAPLPMMGIIRMVILATMGLGALYMFHLLAMDYMKIRKSLVTASAIAPAAAAVGRAILLRGKREANPYLSADYNDFKSLNVTQYVMPEVLKKFEDDMVKLNWKRLINSDPLECLPSLICQIVAGAEKNLTEAKHIRNFIEFSYNSAPEMVQNAYNRGLIFLNKPEMCFSEYPFCIYSAGTMLKILKWFINYML